jgi:gliding motility-associated-like protein
MIEYGDAAQYNMSTTETVVNASCSNPTGGSITITATGGLTPYSYSINGGTPQSSNVFAGLNTGTKTITIRDAGCQVITKTINVGFTDNLTLTASNDTTVCANAPVQMLATANLAGTTFAWSPATGLSNATIANPVATTAANRTYTVTATLNSCVRTEPVVITIKPNPVISAGPDKTIVVGDQVRLEGSANNAVTIAWTPNSTLTNANTFTPTAAPTTTTTYTLTVLNNEGCTSTDQATVNVIPYCIKVMAAFTPNGDGVNERWLVTDGNACTDQIKVAVYNRYGNVVYSNDDYTNNWDGTYKGKPVADGTYYYNITYKTITGKTVLAKGDVTILR